MKHLIHLHILVIAMLCMTACGGVSQSIEETLRQAESEVAKGDMVAATKISQELMGDKNLSQLSATQLSRLSMVYMQIADDDHSDGGTHTATATKLYRMALKADSDSTRTFFTNLPPEQLQYYITLSTLSDQIDNPIDMSTVPNEHEYMEFNPLDTIPS